MEVVLRATAVYLLLLLLFRLSGKRTLAQLTTFDLILVLIISEAVQQALLADNLSIIGAVLVVVTLIGLNRVSDYLSWRSPLVSRLVNDWPVVLVEDGVPNEEPMARYRVTREDILEQARATQAVERMAQIRYAVLERTGAISIIPRGR